MAFKMKNKEVMKLAKEAGNNRISPMKKDDLPPIPGSYEAVMAGEDLGAMEKLYQHMFNELDYAKSNASKRRLKDMMGKIKTKMDLEKVRQGVVTPAQDYYLEDEFKNIPSRQDRLK